MSSRGTHYQAIDDTTEEASHPITRMMDTDEYGG